MLILIDASIAVKFALDEEDASMARLLLDRSLTAPALILSETANAWWKAWRCKALTDAEIASAVASLPSVFAELLPTELLMKAAVEFALELDHPVYDCLYLAHADRVGLPMLTADERLLRKLGSTRHAHLAVPLNAWEAS